ncbi:MAG: UDP-3-O-(3-hydroxymyristoyl)glucosamine N-acyltransferase [Thiotrichaceae bacterium]|nr:MAG: UDP-3-O-(3-hydroxymyristoyl)glucosamine N-acyltransferase [Thiotrichaceae bacterium]
MTMKLSDIANQIDCRLVGDDCNIENVADINQAGNGYLAFVYNARYLPGLKTTKASAVILKEEWLKQCNSSALVSDNPRLAFAKAAHLLNSVIIADKGVSNTAVIASGANIPASVAIDHNAVIKSGTNLGENVQIGACSVIESNVEIGDNTLIYPNVTIGHDIKIGKNCIIYSGAVIGTDGFGYVADGDVYIKVPQLGSVIIGDNVEIGANTTIDRGALLDTIIHDDVKLDNLVQIAHNVEIGKHTAVSACTGIAGSSKIGKNCIIGGGVGIRDNIEITDNVIITGRTFVSSSLKEPGTYSSSVLVDTNQNWKKNVMRFKRLDEMFKRITRLEKTSGK